MEEFSDDIPKNSISDSFFDNFTQYTWDKRNPEDSYFTQQRLDTQRKTFPTFDSGRYIRSLSESNATDIPNILHELHVLNNEVKSLSLNSGESSNSGAKSSQEEDIVQDGNDSEIAAYLSNPTVSIGEKQLLMQLRQIKMNELQSVSEIEVNNSSFKTQTQKKKKVKSKTKSQNSSPIVRQSSNWWKNAAMKKCPIVENENFKGFISMKEAVEGLSEDRLIQGELRINPKNYTEAYVKHPEESQDILILSVTDRNRSLEGDIVIVQLKDKSKWRKQANGAYQKVGEIVQIHEIVHSRSVIGIILRLDKDHILLFPRDTRLPRVKIVIATLPDYLQDDIDNYANVYFKAQIICWNTPKFALGLISALVGKKGEITGETEAVLLELDLDSLPVPESLHVYLPPIPYAIPQPEIQNRLDLRGATIFTIDPETAVDLDDAVSIRQISMDVYEVGVHISDVTYFLTQGTPLDNKVAERATTIYLVDRVNHMLPSELCKLCSLSPGEDKLAVSVIWEMDGQGNILKTNFYRSVIRSCAKLSYKHAQDIIDQKEGLDDLQLYNHKTKNDIEASVFALYSIAKYLTQKRFQGGALKIVQTKVMFKLDDDNFPIDMSVYAPQDSNRLIEEFMLLANQSVAKFLHSKHPKLALLRRHPPPKEDMIMKLESSLNKLGIFIDTSSAGGIHNSIVKYSQFEPARSTVLNCLFLKAMQRALYYCNEEDTHHYALNVNLYTHFTSPIRRYVDIVVHRMLIACLGFERFPPWNVENIKQFAKNSNIKKYAAKRAGDASSYLFTAIYLRQIGQIESEAFIYQINSNSFDAVVSSLALKVRVYLDNLESVSVEYIDNDIASSLNITWIKYNLTQILQLFTQVRLLLKINEEKSLQIEGYLQVPMKY